MQADHLAPIGLTACQAAEYVGMSRRAWGTLCANEGAPEAYLPFRTKRHPRWSRDELRAWVAYGYPPRSKWKPTWAKLVSSGAWSPCASVVTCA